VEDMDLAVRASLKGWKFVYIGDLQVLTTIKHPKSAKITIISESKFLTSEYSRQERYFLASLMM
jgi:GT2 family glycosyltransferase